MSETREGKGSIVFKIIIPLLFIALIYVIISPWQDKLAHDQLMMKSRDRMEKIRAANLLYISDSGTYAPNLNQLVQYFKLKPEYIAIQDSIFKLEEGELFSIDSLLINPVTRTPYKYLNDDTSTVKKYLLECPGGSGFIGSIDNPEDVNKASWE